MNNLNEIILQIKSLFPNEVVKLIDFLTKMLNDTNSIGNFISNEVDIRICKKCNSKQYKNGVTKYGRQKYICSKCKSTCSDTTNSFLFHSHLNYSQLAQLLYCEYHSMTLKQTAELMKVSQTTAFNNRHKLYNCINEIIPKENSNTTEIDGKFVKINLKGTKKQNMPRYSKKRSSKGTGKRGVSGHKVCILTTIDDADNIICEVVGIGPETNEMLNSFGSKYLTNVDVVISDCKNAIVTYCSKRKLEHIQIKSGSYVDNKGNSLARVNSLHSEMEVLFTKYRGISTRHLQSYLNMFVYRKMLNYRCEERDKKDKMSSECIVLKNKTKVVEISKMDFPVDIGNVYSEYNFVQA